MGDPVSSSLVETSVLGGNLRQLLDVDLDPGADLDYALARAIYLWHPLGQKMTESPITLALSQKRKISVEDAPKEVVTAFEKEWDQLGATGHIHNVTKLSRVYGIASLVLGCEEVPTKEPVPLEKLWQLPIFFNVLDPLNTAGSLVLNQLPLSPDFNKPATVRVMGDTFHRSRYQVVMNEAPVYLAFTTSAFGFVGRSVYQRALYPLKSFIRTMIADEMIANKLALLIAKQKQPGSIIDQVMSAIGAVKRAMLKRGQNGQVLQIDVEEEVSAIDMQNVDGAGEYARGNILKNIATAGDMPAFFLENETLTEGFGEGTEDAKNIVRYIEVIRMRMEPAHAWFDNITQYRAWNPDFYKRIQRLNPEVYSGRSYEDVFSEWRRNFAAEWPSLLIEPESEAVKVEEGKFETLIAAAQTLLPELDPDNKARMIECLIDNLNENKRLIPYGMQLDVDALRDFLVEKQERENTAAESAAESGDEKTPPLARRMGSFRG